MSFRLNNWTKIKDPADWSARFVARAISQGGYIWMCGGYDGVRKNDVWKSADGITWTLVVNPAAWPARSAHGFAYFNNKFWVMGGVDSSDTFRRDIWSSVDGITWTLEVASAPWVGRHEFGLVIHENKMWVIGGWNGSALNDVWSSVDGINWVQKTGLPIGIREMAVESFLGKIWVMGGDVGGGNFQNTVFSSMDGSTWTTHSNAAWSARRELQSVVDISLTKMAITGGYGNSGYRNDVWETTNGNTWTLIPQISSYAARSDFCLVNHRGKSYIMAGYSGVSHRDVWSAPSSGFFATPVYGFNPLTVNFSTYNTGPYLWDFGDGTTSTSQNISHTYNATGLYTVSLTSDGTADTAVDLITSIDFIGSPLTGSPPLSVQFNIIS